MKKLKNNNRLNQIQNRHGNHLKKQEGVVLIWAVVFLLVITIVGLSAIRMSGLDTQISGNSVTSMLTYQGAESALGKTAPDTNRLFNIQQASIPANIDDGYDVPSSFFDSFGTETVSGDGVLSSVAKVQVEDQNIECPINMAATSSEMRCHVFRIDATTSLKGTGAKASHTVGVADFAPK